MTVTAVSRCAQCEAVVNVYWPSCLVCRAALPPVPEAPAPSGLIPDNQRRAGRAPRSNSPRLARDVSGSTQGNFLVGLRIERMGRCRSVAGMQERRTVRLTDGQQIPRWIIRAVGKTDQGGRILAAWSVRDHGYDGNGPVPRS